MSQFDLKNAFCAIYFQARESKMVLNWWGHNSVQVLCSKRGSKWPLRSCKGQKVLTDLKKTVTFSHDNWHQNWPHIRIQHPQEPILRHRFELNRTTLNFGWKSAEICLQNLGNPFASSFLKVDSLQRSQIVENGILYKFCVWRKAPSGLWKAAEAKKGQPI